MTSKSQSEKKIPLTIQAPDNATEIFLVSDRFERIESGIGHLEQSVSPGLYKLRFRSGMTQEDRLIEVGKNQSQVVFKEPPLSFESTTPLLNTHDDNPRQRSIAKRQSGNVHLKAGKGSRLYLFIRHQLSGSSKNPGEGVTLHSLEGKTIAGMEDGYHDSENGCWCLNVELDPGTYRLQVDTGGLGTFERFLVACENWQTLFFGMTTDFSLRESKSVEEHITRVLLKSSSVHMMKTGKIFDPASASSRMAELSKIALESGRMVVDEHSFNKLFEENIDNPMFGIYGAHQLLANRRPDYTIIDEIAKQLESLLGPHPDVLSLWLRKSSERMDKKAFTLSSPPMLTRSWELLTRESLRRSSIVPEGSFSDRFSNGMLSTAPWLLHRVTVESETGSSTPSRARTKEMLDDLARISGTTKGYSMLDAALKERKDLTQLELSIAQAMLNQAKQSTANPPSLNKLVENIQVPSVAVKRSTNSLFEKLNLKKDG